MSRTIAFRAWDKSSREMIELSDPHLTYGDGKNKLTFGEHFHDDHYDGEIKDYVLMQFTGLHDAKGKPIYEGDIVQWDAFEGGKRRQVVRYVDDRAEFLPNDMKEAVEVIGNMYEHPELLQEEKQGHMWDGFERAAQILLSYSKPREESK